MLIRMIARVYPHVYPHVAKRNSPAAIPTAITRIHQQHPWLSFMGILSECFVSLFSIEVLALIGAYLIDIVTCA